MNSFYNLTATELSAAVIVINILLSFALQGVAVYIYKKTHQGLSYSSSFVFSFVLIGVLGTVVMMVVQHNLVGAFALLGAFSLIRFRTILKETRDVAFLFFALAIGVAVGTSNYSIAVIATFLISFMIWLFYRYNWGGMNAGVGHILTFGADEKADMKELKDVISGHSKSCDLLQTRTTAANHISYVFSVKLKNDLAAPDLVKELKKHQAVSNIELITGEHGVEY